MFTVCVAVCVAGYRNLVGVVLFSFGFLDPDLMGCRLRCRLPVVVVVLDPDLFLWLCLFSFSLLFLFLFFHFGCVGGLFMFLFIRFGCVGGFFRFGGCCCCFGGLVLFCVGDLFLPGCYSKGFGVQTFRVGGSCL